MLLSLDALTRNVKGLPALMFGHHFTEIVMLASGQYGGQYNPGSREVITAALARYNRRLNLDNAVLLHGTKEPEGDAGLLAMLEPSDLGVRLSVFDGDAYVSRGNVPVRVRASASLYPGTIISFGAPYNPQRQRTAQMNGDNFAAWRVNMDWRV